MKRTIALTAGLFATLVLVLALFVSVAGARPAETAGRAENADPAAPIRAPHVSAQVLVKLRPGVALRSGPAGKRPTSNAGTLDVLLASRGVQAAQQVFTPVAQHTMAQVVRARQVGLERWYRLRLPLDADLPAVLAALRANGNVETAEPDYLGHAAFTPNDPRYAEQWGLTKINAPTAWDTTQGSAAVTIAVLDSGVDLNHPDLAANLWTNPGETPGNGVDDDNNGYVDDVQGWDFVNNDNDPQDDIGHGTHVAGIIAAATNNGTGVAGVCPNCRLMAVKVLDAGGSGTYTNIAAGITYAADKGARVINLSLGGYADSSLLRDAVAYASAYAVVVAAAGNDNKQDRFYPAAYDDYVVAVAATDNSDQKAAFSNYGDWVDLSAPGVSIWSTLWDDSYAAWSGSSMAAPFVSGVAGLVRSQNTGWSAGAVRGQLLHTADAIDGLNPGYAGKLGSGRVNASRALTTTAQPELSVVSYAIDGVANGHPQPGSTVTMTVALKNLWGDATGVTATLSTTDTYVTVTDDTATYGDIAGYATVTNTSDTFAFSVDAGVPYDHLVPFTLTANANGVQATIPVTVVTQNGIEYVGGIISSDTVWTGDKTYVVTSNILVNQGVTLTIQPGTVISYTNTYFLQVDGTLAASGTEQSPIVFKAGGNGIQFTDSSVDYNPATGTGSVIAYTRFDGVSGYNATAIRVQSASPLITHNRIYPQGKGGIEANGNGEISYNEIAGSGYQPLSANGNMLVVRNLIADNNGYVWIGGGEFRNNVLRGNSYGFGCGSHILYVGANTTVEGNLLVDDGTHDMIHVGGACNGAGNTGTSVLVQNNTVINGGRALLVGYTDQPTVVGNNFIRSSFNPGNWMAYLEGHGTALYTVTAESNYWNTSDTSIIEGKIWDRHQDFTVPGILDYDPLLTVPSPSAPGFLYTVSTVPLSPISSGPLTLTLDFSASMSPTIQPTVTFGISPTYDTHIVAGGWISATRWAGSYDVTYYTGDGVQRLRVAGAVGANDGMEIPEDTSHSFTIATIGATAINAEPGYGYVGLSWNPSDLPTAIGYNIYRSTSSGGPYTRINPAAIASTVYTDSAVTNGLQYYYVVRIVSTDLYEREYGSEIAVTPDDYTLPVTPLVTDGGTITHYLDRLHAAWQSSDPESGIAEYRYAIGTAPALRDVVDWTSVSTATEITRTGLSLLDGVTYYFSVKTRNGAGKWSLVGQSDGIQLVQLPAPSIQATWPVSGVRTLAHTLSITGSNFIGNPLPIAYVGNYILPDVTWLAGNLLTATVPANLQTGVYTATVRNYDSQIAALSRAYTVTNPPPVAPADLTLNPSSGRVGTVDSSYQAQVTVSGVNDLAGFQFDLHFDPAIIQATGASVGSFLGSGGRGSGGVGPTIDNANGKVTFGGYSYGSQPGASGSGTLAAVSFAPQISGTSTLTLSNVQLVDTVSTEIPWNVQAGQVQVVVYPFGDFDHDCEVTVNDIMQVAYRWNSHSGDGTYDPQYDFDSDGDIDILDVMRVANVWGTTCTGGGNPLAVAEMAASGPTLRLRPERVVARPGDLLTFDLAAAGVADLGAYQTTLAYDPTALEVVEVQPGPLLATAGNRLLNLKALPAVGQVSFGAFSYGEQPGGTGDGVLARITVRVLAPGTHTLVLSRAHLVDMAAHPVAPGEISGAVVVNARYRLYLPLLVKSQH